MSDSRTSRENEKSEAPEKIDIINLAADFINALKKLWPVLILVMIICTFRSYFSTTISYTPQYVASATVSVTTPGSGYADIEAAEEMAEVFPYILTSGVLEEVIMADMGTDYIPGTIKVKAENGMNMLTISASSGDPQMAYDLLMSVINCYPEVTEYIFGETKLEILDETGIPSDTRKETVIRGSYKRGLLQGAVLSGVILCVYIAEGQTVRSREKLKRLINIRELGTLPYVKMKKRKRKEFNNLCILNERIASFYTESIRRLRIQILRETQEHGYKVLMVTSSIPEEGKTTVAVNIAVSLAKQGKKVMLVDCDLRNPSVAKVLQLEKSGKTELGSVIREAIPIQKAVRRVDAGDGELEVLCSTEADPKDAAVFGTAKMKKFIDYLKRNNDYVILDTAPAAILTDALFLSRYADAAIYVVRYDHTKMQQIRKGIDALGMHRVKIIGFVFNGDRTGGSRRYGYGYGYRRYGSYGRYSHYGHYGKPGDTGKRADPAGRVVKE